VRRLSAADIPDRVLDRVHSRLAENQAGCWLWTRGKNGQGYGMVSWFADGRKVQVLVHRLMYAVTHGEVPEGILVRHTCDVPACANPSHLVLGGTGDNSRDSWRRTRRVNGLSFADAQSIRSDWVAGTSIDAIQSQWSVTRAQASAIIRNRRWVDSSYSNTRRLPRQLTNVTKLTPQIVVEARRKRELGVSVTALAKEYGVAQSTMSEALNGTTWSESAA
jgi:hypothetical protein